MCEWICVISVPAFARTTSGTAQAWLSICVLQMIGSRMNAVISSNSSGSCMSCTEVTVEELRARVRPAKLAVVEALIDTLRGVQTTLSGGFKRPSGGYQ
jgi:hypothetical protein